MSQKKPWVIIFGILGLIVAFFFPYEKLSKPETKVTPTLAQQRHPKAKGNTSLNPDAPAKVELTSEPLPGVAALQKKREEYNALIANRMREIATSDQGAVLSFHIRPRAEAKSCRSGDFDIMKSLVNNPSEKVFALSVENLKGASDSPPSVTRLSLLDIMKGEAHDFAIPKLRYAQEYGVFLCLDTKNTNSCRQKVPLSPSDWDATLAKSRAPDSMLYFQLITSNNNKAYLIPVDKWGADAMADMRSKLKLWLKSPEESLATTAVLMDKLSSLPAEVSGGNLEIPLPYRDPRCDTKASIKGNRRTGGG